MELKKRRDQIGLGKLSMNLSTLHVIITSHYQAKT